MSETELLKGLEQLIDTYGLTRVLCGLSSVCDEKAEHALVNWQDKPTADTWTHDSGCVLQAARFTRSDGYGVEAHKKWRQEEP